MATYLFTKYAGNLEARGAWSSVAHGIRPPGDFVTGVTHCAKMGWELVMALPSSPGAWLVIFKKGADDRQEGAQQNAVRPGASPDLELEAQLAALVVPDEQGAAVAV